MSDKPISPAGERRARIDPPVQRCVALRGCGVYCTPTVVVSSFKNVLRIGPRIRIRRPDGGTARCNALGAPAHTKIPLNPRRRLQHFQGPTLSHVSSITPRATHRGDEHVASGHRRLGGRRGRLDRQRRNASKRA